MMYNMIETDCIHAVALGIHRCWRVSVFGIFYHFFLIFFLTDDTERRMEFRGFSF